MATKRISQFNSLAQGDVDAAADVLPIVDSGAGETKKVTGKALIGAAVADLAATWNNVATTFSAVKMDVTDTASAVGSLLQNFLVGGVQRWAVRKDGELTVGVIPHARLKDNSLGSFYSTADQTGSVSAVTAFTFSDTVGFSSGISIVSSSRITFANAGTYLCSVSVQLSNADSADHDVTIWYRINGSDVTASASKVTVPKTGDGGKTVFELTFIEQVTAGQYIEVVWLPENANVTADHTAAVTGPPAIPATPSVLFYAHRIA